MVLEWSNLKFFYSDHAKVDISDQHVFPMQKYSALRKSLLKNMILRDDQLIPGNPLAKDILFLAHDRKYVNSVIDLSLTEKEARPIGLPLNQSMVTRALTSQGAFHQATLQALADGFSGTLAGGTHHAMTARGEGFCFFNDFAVNVRYLSQERSGFRVLIIDLDVHQGNGNSEILANDSNCFIMSYHAKNSYPRIKIKSSIDREFENKTTDSIYLAQLRHDLQTLSDIHTKSPFDLIMYQAGVDALESDRFGKLSLTREGLEQRNRLVFKFAKEHGISLVFAIGGGYSEPIDNTVQAYVDIFTSAREYFR